MIQREELNQILSFVASRWDAAVKEPDNKAMEGLPNDFWMNSIGGPAGKDGRWVTTIMYTENEDEANRFKDVLLRWQTMQQQSKSPDLIKIKGTDEKTENRN